MKQSINKTNLIYETANAIQGLTQKDAQIIINVFLKKMKEHFKCDETIRLAGFGTFEVKEYPERTGINPNTKKSSVIPAQKRVKFKAASIILE